MCANHQQISAQAAAHAARDELAAVAWDPVVPRPWDRFDASETGLYWLVPGAEWPAHARGKLFFCTDRVLEPGQLFCGIHVEKGFGRVVEQVSPSREGNAGSWMAVGSGTI
jgi:hypothetical protein